jgi:ribonuclease Z
VGFAVTEKDRPGTLRPEKLQAIVERNKDALRSALGVNYLKVFRTIKAMQPHETFTFPDGTAVPIAEVVDAPKKGRKLVVMGDTCAGEMMVPLAMDADVLIHEATNAWLRELDKDKYATPYLLEKDTFNHGHSTPRMGPCVHLQ